jgi:ubiquinone/menaquinone biosynthesis C-methylase UbiE
VTQVLRLRIREALRVYPWLSAAIFACAVGFLIVAWHVHAQAVIVGASIAVCCGVAFLWGYATHLSREWPRLSRLGRSQYGEVWDALSLTEKGAADAAAGITDEASLRLSGEKIADRIAAAVALVDSNDVLEIGSGVGRIGFAFAPRCRSWTGCDRSKNMLSHAQRRLRQFPNAAFVHLQGTGLRELAGESMDVVYCTNVLPHLDAVERWTYVQEAYRVLRPGGRLYLDTILLNSPEGWQTLDNNLQQRRNGIEPPYAPIVSTAEELGAYYERAGFAGARVERSDSLLMVTATK